MTPLTSAVSRAQLELRSVLIAHPVDTAATLKEFVENSIPDGSSACVNERVRHLEFVVLPALAPFGVRAEIESISTAPMLRLQALSGNPQTGLALVEVRYDVVARESSSWVPATITLGALVGCMVRANAQSFDVIRAEARGALERAAKCRASLNAGVPRRFGAFIGAIGSGGQLVLDQYEDSSTHETRAKAA